MNINHLRKEYQEESLDPQTALKSPFDQFHSWFSEVLAAKVEEPNAMVLATASKSGRPSSRTVLLKSVSEEKGLIFFTNYESRKSRELTENPFASATFFWSELERQVCLEGRVERISREESVAYFATRPRASQIGSWASKQDAQVNSRTVLDEAYRLEEKRFEGKEVPCPPFWGGYSLKPDRFEFWQGRAGRMHDRLCYRLAEGVWAVVRLSP